MKKHLYILVASFLLVFIGSQIYFYKKYNGNLVFYISNEMKDNIKLEIYLNSKLVIIDSINGGLTHNYEVYPFKLERKGHDITLKINNNEKGNIKVNTILSTWVIIDIYDDGDNKTELVMSTSKTPPSIM